MLFRLTPASAFPSFMLGKGVDRGPLLNRAVWSVTGQVVWQLLRHDADRLDSAADEVSTAKIRPDSLDEDAGREG